MKKNLKRLSINLICAFIFLSSTAVTSYAAETGGPGMSAAQQTIQQSDRWEGSGDIWRVRSQNGSEYLTNSWFQDLDGSWYMLGADGIMFSGLVTDQSTGKSYLMNTQHDGTYGAIQSGLNEIRNTGINETSLSAIPTDSAVEGPASNHEGENQSDSYEDYINSLKMRPLDQLTRREIADLIEYDTGNEVIMDAYLDMDAAASIRLGGN